jgi:hypothetical protein
MKKIYIVIQTDENGKFYAFADAIRTGQNLKPFIERYKNANIFHLCENRKQAEEIALRWNAVYKANNTYLFDDTF